VARDSATVVVVGGGAVGTSVAYHLTELGITDVVLLERDTLGSGSTAKSAGGFRTQFADELNIRIALRSLAELESFRERFGAEIGFERAGYLFLLDNDADRASFRAALALQHSLGVPSRELTVADVAEVLPQLETADLVAATFCPLDGYATPEAVVAAYAEAARARGVRIRQGEPVERIRVLGGRVLGVATRSTEIVTNTVVCAAGAWSREVARLAGVDVPVQPEPRQMHYTPEGGGLPHPLPLTIDFTSGFYFHSEGPGLVFGGRERSLEELAPVATRRLPLLGDLPVQSTWEGFYEMSPDHNAIVGETAEPSRFLYATGFSGHGFQQSPAVGEHIAERVAGVTPSLDLSAFSLDRFAHGRARREQFVI
jgi:sarcosine oxidase, subunit beta